MPATWKKLIVSGSSPEFNKISGSEGNFDTINANAGALDGVTITAGSVTSNVDVSAKTLTLANDQISGDAIQGGTIGSTTITTLASTNIATTDIAASGNISASGYISASTHVFAGGTGSFGRIKGDSDANTSQLNAGFTVALNSPIGGISDGDVINIGENVESILRSMLLQFVPPTFTSFDIDDLEAFMEVGDTEGSTINSGNFTTASSTSQTVAGTPGAGSGFQNADGSFLLTLAGNANALGAGTTYTNNNDSAGVDTAEISFPAVVVHRETMGSVTFTLKGTDAEANITSKYDSCNFRLPIFYGGSPETGESPSDADLDDIIDDIKSSVISTAGLTEQIIPASSTYGLQTLLDATTWQADTRIVLPSSVNNGANYTYIIYPSSYGALTTISDLTNTSHFGSFALKGTADHTRFSITTEYNIYRSNGQDAFASDFTLKLNTAATQ